MASFKWPTDTKRITSKFRTSARPDHHGVDIAEGGYHPIYAVASGTVTKSYTSTSYGECIMIKHSINGQIWESVYAHMKAGTRTVFVGDKVKQGQQIGIMGNTGHSTGQHLHFELHKGRWDINKTKAVDPLDHLEKNIAPSKTKPSSNSNYPKRGQITGDVWSQEQANFSPNRRVKVLKKGSTWKVHGEKNGYYNLGSEWVNKKYMKIIDHNYTQSEQNKVSGKKPSSKPSNIKAVGKIKMTGVNNYTFIYSKTSDKSTRLGQAHKNKVFNIAGSVPGWYEVIYEGKRGYIKDKYASRV